MPPAHGASRLYDWQDDDDSGNDSPAAFSTVSVGGTLRGKQAQPSRDPVPGRAQPKRGSGRTSAPSRTSRTEFLFGADALPLGQPEESSVRQGSRPHRGASLDLEFGDDDRRRGRTRSEKSRRRISAAGPPEELPTTRRLGCVHCALVCGLFLLAAAGFVGWAAATSEPPAATTTPAAVGQAAGHASPLSPPPPPPPRPAAPPPPPPSPPPPPPFVPALTACISEVAEAVHAVRRNHLRTQARMNLVVSAMRPILDRHYPVLGYVGQLYCTAWQLSAGRSWRDSGMSTYPMYNHAAWVSLACPGLKGDGTPGTPLWVKGRLKYSCTTNNYNGVRSWLHNKFDPTASRDRAWLQSNENVWGCNHNNHQTYRSISAYTLEPGDGGGGGVTHEHLRRDACDKIRAWTEARAAGQPARMHGDIQEWLKKTDPDDNGQAGIQHEFGMYNAERMIAASFNERALKEDLEDWLDECAAAAECAKARLAGSRTHSPCAPAAGTCFTTTTRRRFTAPCGRSSSTTTRSTASPSSTSARGSATSTSAASTSRPTPSSTSSASAATGAATASSSDGATPTGATRRRRASTRARSTRRSSGRATRAPGTPSPTSRRGATTACER